MATDSESLNRIEILVELPASTNEFAGMVHRELARYVDEILEDLRVPAEADLAVHINDENCGSLFPYRMHIDGQECRIPLQYPLTEDGPILPDASEIARALYINRELLLSGTRCGKIRERWLGENAQAYFSEFSPHDFHDLLTFLVRRGSHIERAKTLSEGIAAAGEQRSIPRCFEAIIADPDATAIQILFSRYSAIDRLSFQELLDDWDEDIFAQLGIILPTVTLAESPDLEEPEFRILINDLRLPRMRQPSIARDPGAAGFAEFVIQRLAAEVRRHAGHFMNTAVMQCCLDLLRESAPALVDAILKRFDIVMLARVMRELLEDEISIRDARRVLEYLLAVEGMMEIGPVDSRNTAVFDLAFYSDEARESLRRYITQKHFGKEFCLNVLTINPDIESTLASASREPFGETERSRLLESILRSVTEAGDLASEIVLVTRPEARKQLRELITKEIPMLPVISYRDLSPDANVRPVGEITCEMLPRDH
jgi:FHIPEP family